MSDSKAATEPSMEEILASIRRILAEDDGTALAPGRPHEDVFDLTEAIGDDGTIRHIPLAAAAKAPPLAEGRAEPLLSAVASGAAAASFARLTQVAREPRLGTEGGLETLVRDTLRPMLQAWLDENLPDLVERLVRDEIARMVGEQPRR